MCEHCHEEEYNAVILNLEDQEPGVRQLSPF